MAQEKQKDYRQVPLEDRRPRLSKEAAIFNEQIDKFVDLVDRHLYDIPSDYNLLQYLQKTMGPMGYDITTARLKAYEDEAEVHGFGEGFSKLKMYREHFWEMKSTDKGCVTSAIFHLKQPQNGGYTDKQETSSEPIELKVTINGCSDAFK